MRSQTIAACCGFATIESFYGQDKKSLDDLTKFIERAKEKVGGINYLVVLNEVQNLTWEETLRSHGFTILRRHLYNPVHSNWLVLWLWEKHPERSPDNPEWDESKFILKDSSTKGREIRSADNKNLKSYGSEDD